MPDTLMEYEETTVVLSPRWEVFLPLLKLLQSLLIWLRYKTQSEIEGL